MSLTLTAGALLLQSSGNATTESFGTMKSNAARVVGGATVDAVKAEAGAGIIRGIDDINMRHFFNFGSETQSDATIVDGTSEYSLPVGNFGVRAAQLIDTNSKVYRTLEYVPWEDFQNVEQPQTATGTPTKFTIRNLVDDEQVVIYPVPSASEATSYTLRIHNFMRIAQLSGDADAIIAPRELTDVLTTYAEFHVYRWAGRKRDADAALALYGNKLAAFKWQNRRSTDLPRQRRLKLKWPTSRIIPRTF